MSTSLIMKEMQIKLSMKYQHSHLRLPRLMVSNGHTGMWDSFFNMLVVGMDTHQSF